MTSSTDAGLELDTAAHVDATIASVVRGLAAGLPEHRAELAALLARADAVEGYPARVALGDALALALSATRRRRSR